MFLCTHVHAPIAHIEGRGRLMGEQQNGLGNKSFVCGANEAEFGFPTPTKHWMDTAGLL